MKKIIRINFSDFWPDLNPYDNYFTNILRENYEVEISNNPDVLFYSVFGNNHERFKCIKVFFSGENIGPDYNKCDYSMCYDYSNDQRHYRLPLYILYGGYYDLVNKKVDESLVNRKFCNFIVSNGNCVIRNRFFEKLSKYKKVDSGGGYNNNIGYLVGNKLEFQSQYKFSLAFENDAYRTNREGYTTEKILHAMQANTLPIYWGNPLIGKEFNNKSIINYHDFKSEEDMIDYIIYLDNNDDKYIEKLRQPWLINNEILESNKVDNIKSFLYKIFKKI